MKMKKLTPSLRLKMIADIINLVDQRCLAADGPVTSTLSEMEPKEIKKIWLLAKPYLAKK